MHNSFRVLISYFKDYSQWWKCTFLLVVLLWVGLEFRVLVWLQWLLQSLYVAASVSCTWCCCPWCWTLLSRHVLQTLALCSLLAELSGLVSLSPRGCCTDVPAEFRQFRTSKCTFHPRQFLSNTFWNVFTGYSDILWLSPLGSEGEFFFFFFF